MGSFGDKSPKMKENEKYSSMAEGNLSNDHLESVVGGPGDYKVYSEDDSKR